MSNTGQLSLLLSVWRKMNNNQSVVMLCNKGERQEWLTPFVDKCVVQVKLCDPTFLMMSLTHIKLLYKRYPQQL